MNVIPRTIRTYFTPVGREPFQEWFAQLKDSKVRSAILTRIDRLRSGNFGDCRRLTGNLYELRIHYSAGYRIYFGDLDGVIVILLCGGTKRTQQRDIQRAMSYWQEFRSREP